MEPYKQAVRICERLKEEGYIAYFAGGWVRDWLLGHPSSDIDIATDAPLTVILDLFPRTILVGMAFGVIVVQMEGHAFELAIFRRDVSYTDGRKPDKIEPSNPVEDAKRRDFTINGMFYDPLEDKIWDFVGGQEDLKKGVIRAIGDPWERFQEDRLRMIRAVRFSARFGFHIDPETQEAIVENAPTLYPAVAPERIYQEFSKMNESPHFNEALIELHRLGLLAEIFSELRDIHLKRFKELCTNIPSSIPLIAKLRELLKHLPIEKQKEALLALKISAKEADLIDFLTHAEKNLKEKNFKNPIDWARFYAHPSSEVALNLYGNRQEHIKRQRDLQKSIQRLIEKKPLVTSGHLKAMGIPPGKEMGILLKKAEEIAVNQNLDDPEAVIRELKKYA